MRGPKTETQALFLNQAESRDDRIVTLLSRDHGRLSAVARRARRPRSRKLRLGGHIAPITLSEVVLQMDPQNNLATLLEANTIETFGVIKADLTRLSLASVMAEVVIHLSAEYAPERTLFDLLGRAWRALNDPKRQASEELLLLFELRALKNAGLLPELTQLSGLESGPLTVVQAWLEGRWGLLGSDSERSQVAKILETMIQEASGKILKSRNFLESTRELGAS